MSDFKYDLLSSYGSLDDGKAYITNTQLYFTTISNTGLDLTDFLGVWVDDASLKVPFDIKFTITPSSGESVTESIPVTEIIVTNPTTYKFNLGEDFEDKFQGTDTKSGVVSMELGLKPVPSVRPCGGYEEMIVTKDDNPKCTNSCVFKNTVSGREFIFNNIDLGTFDFRFEGPNERYEIIWGSPQGCVEADIKILNRVEGNKLFLEDYGNQAEEFWNFVDLMIEVKYGSYEWAGGDEDPVFYITANNGTLCAPGEVCQGGQCVPEGSISDRLDFDDILLLHNGEQQELYSVRAGDYMTRSSNTYTLPVTRGDVTFQSTVFNWDNLEDTDTISVYRPSNSTVYQITGKQYRYEFLYRSIKPEILGVRLYKKFPELSTFEDQTFVLEIDTNDTSGQTKFDVATRIITTKPVAKLNTSASIKLRESLDTERYLDGDRSPETLDFFGDVWAIRDDETWTQDFSGATLTFRQSGSDLVDLNKWRDFWVGRNCEISGDPDLTQPWHKSVTNGFYIRETDPIRVLSDRVTSVTFQVVDGSPENLPLFIPGTDVPVEDGVTVDCSRLDTGGGAYYLQYGVDMRTLTLDSKVGAKGDNFLGSSRDALDLVKSKPEGQYNLVSDPRYSPHRFINIESGLVETIDDRMTIETLNYANKFEFVFTEEDIRDGETADEYNSGGAYLVASVGAYNSKGEDYWFQSNYLLAN